MPWSNSDLRFLNTENHPSHQPNFFSNLNPSYFTASIDIGDDLIYPYSFEILNIDPHIGNDIFSSPIEIYTKYLNELIDYEIFREHYKEKLKTSFKQNKKYWKEYIFCQRLVVKGGDEKDVKHSTRAIFIEAFMKLRHSLKEEATFYGDITENGLYHYKVPLLGDEI